jgi:hypothetical protein
MSDEVTDPQRQVAHVLLDVMSAVVGPDGIPTGAPVGRALQRLEDVQLGRVNRDGTAAIYLDNLLTGAALMLGHLALQLANCRGVDYHDVIVDTREFLDSL